MPPGGFEIGIGLGLLDALVALAPRDWSRIDVTLGRTVAGGFALEHLVVVEGAGPKAMLPAADGAGLLAILAAEIAERNAEWDGLIGIDREADGAHRFETSFATWTVSAEDSTRASMGGAIVTALGDSYQARVSRQAAFEAEYGSADETWSLDPVAATLTTPKGPLSVDLLAAYSPPELRFVAALADLPEPLAARASALAAGPDAPAWLTPPVRVLFAPSYALALADLVGHALDVDGVLAWPNGDTVLYLGLTSLRERS